MLAKVSLDLDNFSDPLAGSNAMNQPFAKQFRRNERGGTGVKLAREFLHGGRLTQFPV